MKKSSLKVNLLLLLAVIVLAISALLLNSNGEFGGSDGEAEDVITELAPDYEPWFSSIMEPKSGEIESLLFTLQGSIGVGIIAYVIGYSRGKNKHAVH